MAHDRSNQHVGNDNASDSATSENDGISGQPIGGNDSNMGSGTTLTQGADFTAEGPGSEARSEKPGSESSKDEGFIGSKKTEYGRDPINDEDEAEE